MRRPLPHGFLSRLEGIVGERFVRTDEEALLACSRDKTPGLEPALPDVVVRPGTSEEVLEVVRAAAEAGVYVTPRGAGTGKAGGCVPVYGGLVLDLGRLSRVLLIDAENLVARVEPGVILGDFQAAVEAEGLFYPPDPASLSSCTLGGNVATDAGGPRALKYGVTSHYVLGLEAVLPTGERVRAGRQTVKGVTGYDLVRLLCGSEGTLAVLTEITLRLVPLPGAVKTALCVFSSSRAAASAVAGILRAGIVPRALEYMDRASIEAVRATPAPYRFPEGANAALLLETDAETEEAAFHALSRAVEVASAHGALDALVATSERQRREVWESRWRLSEVVRRMKPKKVSEDIVVPRSRIPEMVARLDELGERHGLFTCAFGHAGDGNLHAQILFDDVAELPKVNALLDELFRLTVEMGGTITGEHGVGVAKRAFLAYEQSDALIKLERRIKAAFDPAGILNPGKMLPDKLVRWMRAKAR